MNVVHLRGTQTLPPWGLRIRRVGHKIRGIVVREGCRVHRSHPLARQAHLRADYYWREHKICIGPSSGSGDIIVGEGGSIRTGHDDALGVRSGLSSHMRRLQQFGNITDRIDHAHHHGAIDVDIKRSDGQLQQWNELHASVLCVPVQHQGKERLVCVKRVQQGRIRCGPQLVVHLQALHLEVGHIFLRKQRVLHVNPRHGDVDKFLRNVIHQ
mmetsp:Transcript_28870/g.49586  ORF Transcript_28870/g.49586 Transcript_28870/m.49586 type:complete len:212 (-) Transcript_28870:2322-2957(-)